MSDLSTKNGTQADLPLVRSLWRKNSRTLGYLPDGAFLEALADDRIIVAKADGQFAGYVLYRLSRGRATIVHLCSEERLRGKGIAQALNEELLRRTCTQGCSGVGLCCRRDYGLSDFWAHLGYVPLKEKPGRSATGHPLTFWWCDHHQPDLFTLADGATGDARLVVAIDTNVLIRLHGTDGAHDNEVAKALEADWLADLVEVCVTPEAFVEANRSSDDARRRKTRQWIQQHRVLQSDATAVENARSVLGKYFPPESLVTENDISDFNHAAYALAGGAETLITLDGDFLDRAARIGEDIGLRVVDPAGFILEIDQLLREHEYAPSRLAGSRIRSRLVQDSDRVLLTTHFQAAGSGESRAQFEAKLRTFLAQPAAYSVRCYEHPEDGLLALLVQESAGDGTTTVTLFRVRDHRLTPTIARHVLSQLISDRSDGERRTFAIVDDHLPQAVTDALQECRFRKAGDSYVRTAYPGIHPLADVVQLVQTQGLEMGSACDLENVSPQVALNIECSIWPGKVSDSPLPTFVVPIHPTFAMHLFDARLANADLLGAQADLALACENVYYRSNQACGLTAPARVLWYVKKSDDCEDCMSIRACSLLSELLIDTPKRLYRRYRRLGVYDWRDLAGMVKDVNRDKIMAFLFSHTELFSSPIPWARFRDLGINSTLQSPLRVSSATFETIYRQGITRG